MTSDPFDFDFGDPAGAGDAAPDPFDFDLSAFGGVAADADETVVQTSFVKPRLYVGTRRQPVLYDNAVQLARDAGTDILRGDRVDAVVSGNFIFGDFLEALHAEHNLYTAEMTLSTLALGHENVDSLRNLLTGGFLGGLTLVVSDYWYSHNRHNVSYVHEQLAGLTRPDGTEARFRLAVAGTHTKICLLGIPPQHGRNAQRLVIHGSANLRSSRSVEAFTAETNPVLFDFHAEWHSRIAEHFSTDPSPLRASTLYDFLTAPEPASSPSPTP